MDIKYIVKDYFSSKNFQEFINRRFRDDSYVVVKKEGVKYISYGEGLHLSPKSFTIHGRVESMILDNPYHVENIYPNDVVIDVGSNIGGFTLLAATRTKNKIVSVEPLSVLYDALVESISLNGMEKQIIPLKKALGSGGKIYVSWGEGGYAETVTLSELLEMAGGRCDFLKMNCEGGEWDGILQCDKLDKIGRVAMYYHCYTEKDDVNLLVRKFKDCGFDVKIAPIDDWKPILKEDPKHIGMIHCTRGDWKHS